MSPEDDSSEIEKRRFETESSRSFDIRTGRLKRDKSRYSNTNLEDWESSQSGVPTRTSRLLIGIGAVALIVGGTFVLGYALKSSDRKEISSELATNERREAVVAVENTNSALRETVSAYFTAETVEEKLQFVRRKHAVEPLMRRFYNNHPEKLERKELAELKVIRRMFRINPDKIGEDRSVYIVVATRTDGVADALFIEELNDDFTVDWETHVRWNPMTRDELLQQRPTITQPFRVYLNYSDRYFEPYPKDDYLAVQLVFPDKIETVDAFILRTNPGVKTLKNLIETQRLPPVILGLKVAADFDGDAVEIETLIQPQWFVSD